MTSRCPDIIGFASRAQLANIIAPIQTDRAGSVRQTVFHPLALFSNQCGQWCVAARSESPLLESTKLSVLDVAASVHETGGTLSVVVVNRHARTAVEAEIHFTDQQRAILGGIELSAAALTDSNPLAHPVMECVRTKTLPPAAEAGSRVFPPASITVLHFGSRTIDGKTKASPASH